MNPVLLLALGYLLYLKANDKKDEGTEPGRNESTNLPGFTPSLELAITDPYFERPVIESRNPSLVIPGTSLSISARGYFDLTEQEKDYIKDAADYAHTIEYIARQSGFYENAVVITQIFGNGWQHIAKDWMQGANEAAKYAQELGGYVPVIGHIVGAIVGALKALFDVMGEREKRSKEMARICNSFEKFFQIIGPPPVSYLWYLHGTDGALALHGTDQGFNEFTSFRFAFLVDLLWTPLKMKNTSWYGDYKPKLIDKSKPIRTKRASTKLIQRYTDMDLIRVWFNIESPSGLRDVFWSAVKMQARKKYLGLFNRSDFAEVFKSLKRANYPLVRSNMGHITNLGQQQRYVSVDLEDISTV